MTKKKLAAKWLKQSLDIIKTAKAMQASLIASTPPHRRGKDSEEMRAFYFAMGKSIAKAQQLQKCAHELLKEVE